VAKCCHKATPIQKFGEIILFYFLKILKRVTKFGPKKYFFRESVANWVKIGMGMLATGGCI
jgi:hypothetical protein